MRLLHTSDWHLGRRLHGEDLLDEQRGFLEWLCALAVAEQVDVVVVAGDVYDRAQPGADAISLLDATIAAFARSRVPMVISSGNHDSAVRLAYAGPLLADAGIHVRTSVEQVTDPVVLLDGSGPVGIYAIPFVLPDAVPSLGQGPRSHGAVLAELTDRIRADARRRELRRVVVMSHAFVTGGSSSDSEREIRVGGVGDTPAAVFDGFTYVALGHLHGPQEVAIAGSATVVQYSGSPLAFSFSERTHTKSVAIVDLDERGAVTSRRVPTPIAFPLMQVTGRLADLEARAESGELSDLRAARVKVVLTDPGRVANPMARLRALWPHTITLEFAPDRPDSTTQLVRATDAVDPTGICLEFVETVSGEPASALQESLLAEAVVAARRSEVMS